MFTGIIEEVGTITGFLTSQKAGSLHINARLVVEGSKIGDSIAVNGVCLTVTEFTANGFVVDVMPETLKRTNLGELRNGELVNLERAMSIGDRLGGHLVSGHVDGKGRMLSKRQNENAILFEIEAGAGIQRYLIPQGSITVDGISLTVVAIKANSFSVSVIPHTAAVTTLGKKQVGDCVNLENDVIGKYVERLLASQGNVLHSLHSARNKQHSVTESFLRDNGFV
ncbi:riboflavin synthase [Brevibacillus laterosporus]|uniref:Riboflavin synthase n=2 Tax=Brevibacillus TaxID=55080 RepID=A0A0F7C1B8_BRELA|nr:MULTISPECIES: riboflavin synthase [Brevibacillus]AKF95764.1 riboflavin synthase subunit alpha [Brevibacillus laterosporus]MCR8985519.1 riboflavin synthase [Brevibacillus laterosporus]MCZ0831253.1 riboflavin synthase [Brevibacillus halotolerans]GIO01795.1 riboflavin synthase subunit alpha [Brevibacillus halotolerans]